MARENPPRAPASRAQAMLARSGNAPPSSAATASIKASAQRWEKAVRTKALARREPNPPAKSEAPQRKTAVTEEATAAEENWAGRNTPDESSTRHGFR